eukprot:scaffold2139_cov170-Pinguiococcus_pyrenoidosus.AAC.1
MPSIESPPRCRESLLVLFQHPSTKAACPSEYRECDPASYLQRLHPSKDSSSAVPTPCSLTPLDPAPPPLSRSSDFFSSESGGQFSFASGAKLISFLRGSA